NVKRTYARRCCSRPTAHRRSIKNDPLLKRAAALAHLFRRESACAEPTRQCRYQSQRLAAVGSDGQKRAFFQPRAAIWLNWARRFLSRWLVGVQATRGVFLPHFEQWAGAVQANRLATAFGLGGAPGLQLADARAIESGRGKALRPWECA